MEFSPGIVLITGCRALTEATWASETVMAFP
jgi:hypothetical protein